MIDFGNLHFFLGLEVQYTSKGIHVTQQKYIRDLLKKYECQMQSLVLLLQLSIRLLTLVDHALLKMLSHIEL